MSAVGEQKPPSNMHRKQRAKNVALLLILFAFAAIVYLVTIVRLGGQ